MNLPECVVGSVSYEKQAKMNIYMNSNTDGRVLYRRGERGESPSLSTVPCWPSSRDLQVFLALQLRNFLLWRPTSCCDGSHVTLATFLKTYVLFLPW